MIRDTNQFFPGFQKIVVNKNARLLPEGVKTVVSQVRTLQKQVDPINCSYNPNAIIKDSDLALEQIKRREYNFNQTMQKELSKLNNKFIPQKKTHPSHLSQDSKPFKSFRLSIKPIHAANRRLNSYSPALDSGKLTLNKNVYDRLSTPVPSNERTRYCSTEMKNYKVNQVEKVLDDCMKFSEDMKKMKGKYEDIDAAGMEEKINIDQFLKGDKGKKGSESVLDDERIELDMKMAKACIRGRKIWKMNHVSFIATVDRKMNSVPLVKK